MFKDMVCALSKNKQLQYRLLFMWILTAIVIFTYPVWKEDHHKQVVKDSGKIEALYKRSNRDSNGNSSITHLVKLENGNVYQISKENYNKFSVCNNCNINIYKDRYTRSNFGIFLCSIYLLSCLGLAIFIIEMFFKYIVSFLMFFRWALNHSNEKTYAEFMSDHNKDRERYR